MLRRFIRFSYEMCSIAGICASEIGGEVVNKKESDMFIGLEYHRIDYVK